MKKLTAEQAEQYLGKPRLECLICRHSFTDLETHVIEAHGTTPAQYREDHGLPEGCCLVAVKDHARGIDQGVRMALVDALEAMKTEYELCLLESDEDQNARESLVVTIDALLGLMRRV